MDPEVVLARASLHARAGQLARAFPFHDGLHHLLPMRNRWLNCWLGLLLSVTAQLRADSNTVVNVTVMVTPDAYAELVGGLQQLRTSVDGMNQAFGQGFGNVSTSINAVNTAQTQRHLEFMLAMGGIATHHATAAANLGTIMTQMEGINASFTSMVPAIDQLRVAMILNTQNGAAFASSVNNFGAQVGNLGTTVAGAITASGVATANNFNTTVGPKLDAIKSVLLTNGFGGTNIVNVSTTNGTVTLTNNVNVTIPALNELEAMATEMRTGRDGLVATHAALTTPPNFYTLKESAEASNPFKNLTMTQPNVVIPPMPNEFMRITVPKPGAGGAWIFDLNPMSRFPQLVTGFRTGIEWVLTLAFLCACGKLAHDFISSQAQVNQPKGPNAEVMGNNVGVIAAVAYVGLYVLLAGMWIFAIDAMFNFNGTVLTGSFAKIGTSPFSGMTAESVYLADMFFPLVLIVTQAVWLGTARYSLLGTHWVCIQIVRFLPS